MTPIDTFDRFLAQRYDRRFPKVVQECDGPRWHRLDDLLAGGIETHLATYSTVTGTPSDTTAAYFTGWITGQVLAPVVWAYTLHRRLPVLEHAEVRLRSRDQGWFDAVGYGPMRSVAADPAVLRARLVTAVKELGSPLVDAIGAHCRLGRRALWAHVTDTVANAFVPTPPVGAAARAATVEADRVIQPLGRPPTWVTRHDAVYGIGQSCCLSYKVTGETNCERVCPKLDEATRAQQTAAWLESLARAAPNSN